MYQQATQTLFVRIFVCGLSIESMKTNLVIDSVSLTITNLERSLDFYLNILGFDLHSRNENSAKLGSQNHQFLALVENPDAKRYRRPAGLYHFAVLVPSRIELARMLWQLIETQTPLQGLSDHGVSEAIYLPDPDGNGIEIYRDRPQSEWPKQNGELQMVSLPLDVDHLFSEFGAKSQQFSGLPADTFLGHIHLHVGDIAAAEDFYARFLGFDLMQRYGNSASFLSLNGYHHHIGINTWMGTGTSSLPQDAIGLRWFSINGSNEMLAHVKSSQSKFEENEQGIFLRDPFENGVYIR